MNRQIIEAYGVEVNNLVNCMHCSQQITKKAELMAVSAIEALFSGSGGKVVGTARVLLVYATPSAPAVLQSPS
jgi:hypothetical protein